MRALILTSIFSLSVALPLSLFDLLTNTPFLHSGTVKSGDKLFSIGRPCSYLEPENVTVAPASGIGWTEGGSCPLLYTFDCPPSGCPPPTCSESPAHAGFDRAGSDFLAFALPATVNGSACAAACCANIVCESWVYAPVAPAGQEPSCNAGEPCCYLKSSAPAEVPSTLGLFNGLVVRGTSPNVSSPPMGLRSAAPLGGIGAGAFELRTDGTIHEVTIVNQSPAGAAKFGVLENMMLGARVNGVTRALRTTPPFYAVNESASGLTYAALYPLASLSFASPSIDFDTNGATSVGVFAYSTLLPGNPTASASPSVIFTLAVTNAGDTSLETSFFLSLPLGSVNDCARRSTLPLLANISNLLTPAACLSACATQINCLSWTFETTFCLLARDIPLSVHADSVTCGVRGTWSGDDTALTLAMPCTDNSPACGDVTLRPLSADNALPSLGASHDPSLLWRQFSATGGFTDGDGVSAGTFADAYMGHGAASVTLNVLPHTNATLTIIFAWSFPHRDHAGEDIGNYYSTLFEDSADTARVLATPGAVETVVTNLAAHHSVFIGNGSSLPDWLADFIVNGMSHFRGMIWSKDGRMREFEAFDCMDVDSIHNDYQRHLPYLWTMPEFEVGKLRKWASGQDPSGYIQEFLGPFGVGPFDIPGGRIMADTTTLWVVELFEIWRATGDEALLTDLYPTATRALTWLMNNSAPLGLPEKLYSTYDILWLDSYNTTAYNAFLYMAALRAGSVLAVHAGDNVTATAVDAALVRAEGATQTLLWNGSSGFFRAYSWNGDNAVMADSLYGAVIAAHLGLGFLADPAQLSSHLTAEMVHNYDPAGFVAVTGRVSPPPNGRVSGSDDKLWQQAGPDWSSLAIFLAASGPTGKNVSAALDPARRQIENWRTRLHTLWNLAGLTSDSGDSNEDLRALPFCTAHYGYALTAYWLLPALSGQVIDLPKGTLTFNLAVPCPARLPAVTAGLEGTISCDIREQFTFELVFGTLQLPLGGLSANGKVYTGSVNLGPGDSVSWS